MLWLRCATWTSEVGSFEEPMQRKSGSTRGRCGTPAHCWSGWELKAWGSIVLGPRDDALTARQCVCGISFSLDMLMRSKADDL